MTRTTDDRLKLDGPQRLLVVAVRLLPKERRDWGIAMLAELAPLQHTATRWRFALGCTRVSLFTPRRGGLFQNDMKHTIRGTFANLGSAALISAFLVLPFATLQFTNNIVTRRDIPGLIVLFGLLLFLPMAFVLILSAMVQTARMGNSIVANPLGLLFRLVLMAFCAGMWGAIIIDQLPCFLGAPNCD
jgi:hypothetical protein